MYYVNINEAFSAPAKYYQN